MDIGSRGEQNGLEDAEIIIVLPVVLYGCETWSLTLREERRLRVFENRVLREISGAKWNEVIGSGENYTMRSLIICIAHQYCSGDKIEKNEVGGKCSMYGGEERCIKGFLVRTPEERDHLGDPGVDGRIILRWIFRKWDVGVWTGSSCLRIGTGGGHLSVQ